ncbi:MAG: arylsulfatase [Verrucomicrobia bacterium]|nr:arylsulfatase [Verrucomicrobiota bacterium]
MKSFLTFSLWLTLAAGLPAADTPRPNILFLLSDDHSYPFLSCYGDTNVTTPTLDRLAAEGMKFHRFFTAAPQCVPSRAAFMTGRSPVAARITRFSAPLARDEITFPEVLKRDAGYFVGVCGRSYHLDGSGQRGGAAMGELLEKHGLRTFEQRFDYVKTGSDAAAATQAAEFLDRKPADQPFCLWVNFSDPHHVWNAPEEFRPPPASLKLPAHWPDLPGMREQLADYCAEVNRLDRSVKAVLDLIESRGFTANTLVVFTGDNGAALPHGKGSLYDPGSNVPFLVRWPGVVKPGGESHALLSGEDLAPTLLAAAGLPAPSRMSGVSFLPLLKGQPHRPRQHIFVERGPHGSAPVTVNMSNSGYDLSRAVRSDRYKFIYNCTPWIPYSPVDSGGGAAWTQMKAAYAEGKLAAGLSATYFTTPRPVYELYDLEADPSELNNLSGQPQFAALERELRVALGEKMILDFDYLPLPAIPDPPGPGGVTPAARGGNRAAQFGRLDTDKDGRLSQAEFSVGRPANEAERWFRQRDGNRDGYLSREEYLSQSPRSPSRRTGPDELASP